MTAQTQYLAEINFDGRLANVLSIYATGYSRKMKVAQAFADNNSDVNTQPQGVFYDKHMGLKVDFGRLENFKNASKNVVEIATANVIRQNGRDIGRGQHAQGIPAMAREIVKLPKPAEKLPSNVLAFRPIESLRQTG